MDHERTQDRLLWLGVLLPPALWLTQFEIMYGLSRWVCDYRWTGTAQHIVSWAFLAGIVAAGWIAMHELRRSPHSEANSMDDAVVDRSRFMALVGVMLASLFALITIGQWSAKFFIDPCNY